LRQGMVDDMTVRHLAPNTMLCYLKQVSYLARYFAGSPEQLGPEQVREYQIYLARDRRVSVNSRRREHSPIVRRHSLRRNAISRPSAGESQASGHRNRWRGSFDQGRFTLRRVLSGPRGIRTPRTELTRLGVGSTSLIRWEEAPHDGIRRRGYRRLGGLYSWHGWFAPVRLGDQTYRDLARDPRHGSRRPFPNSEHSDYPRWKVAGLPGCQISFGTVPSRGVEVRCEPAKTARLRPAMAEPAQSPVVREDA